MMQLADELELQTCTGTETGSHFAHFADGRKLTFETDPGNPLSSLGKMDYGTFITKVKLGQTGSLSAGIKTGKAIG